MYDNDLNLLGDVKVLKILNLNLKIDNNLLDVVKFTDKKMEDYFQIKKSEDFSNGDTIIKLGWISTLLYVYFIYYRVIIFTIILLLMSLSFYLIRLRKKLHNYSNKINFVQICLFSIFMNFKCFHLNLFVNEDEQEIQKELIRLIVFDFITFNLLEFVLLKQSFFSRLIFLTINLISVFISKCFRANNHFHMDGVTSIIMTLIFYLLKNRWEYNRRLLFAYTYCLEKSLEYSTDFINQLKGIHLAKRDEFITLAGRESHNKFCFFFSKEYNPFNNLNQESRVFIEDTNDNFNNLVNSMIEYNRDTYIKNNIDSNNKKCLKLPNLNEDGIIKPNKFTPLGFFSNKFLKDEFYEIFYRKFYLNEQTCIEDIFFYDISDLIQAEMKIQEENKIKRRLIAKMSHEFKTPLYSILGTIEDIKENNFKDSQDFSDKLNTITSLSKYLVLLTQDVIQFTTFQSTNIDYLSINKTNLDVREIIKFSHDILICLLKCSNDKIEKITPVVKIDDNIDHLIINNDETRLKQILINFISNAVKFTNSGNISIFVEPDVSMKYLKINVTDTGIGINMEKNKMLFDNFNLNNKNIIDNSESGGLGLSICQSIARAIGVKINFISHLVGSTFYIEIPCCKKNLQSSRDENIIKLKKLPKTKIFDINEFNFQIKSNRNIFSNHLSEKEEFIIHRADSFAVSQISDNKSFKGKSNNHIENDNYKIDNDNSIDIKSDNSIDVDSDIDSDNTFQLEKFKRPHLLRKPYRNFSFNLIEKRLNSQSGNEKKSENNENELIYDDIETGSIIFLLKVRYSSSIAIKYNIDDVYFKKGKVVIIDDNKIITKSLKKLVESYLITTNRKYEVIMGYDGLDLIRYVIQDQKDNNMIRCIITDENMEYIDGSEAIKIIRSLEKKGVVKPIIIFTCTCHEDKNTQNIIINAGSQRILPKPLYEKELIKAFRDFNI